MASPWLKASFGLAVAACALVSADAGAEPLRGRRDPRVVGYVVAQSDYGNRTVVGPVRRGRFGYEVRLPGGNWVDCRGDCAEELRVQTVDFWESRGPNGVPGHRLLGLKWFWYD